MTRRLLLALSVLGLALSAARADDWPQWLGPKRDAVWRESGILEKFPKDGPKLRWKAPVGYGYAGPAVAAGRVYVTDWVPNEGVKIPSNPFSSPALAGTERVHCLDDKTGKTVWTHDYPCSYQVSYAGGPRTTPLIAGGKVYTLGTMGDLLCLDDKDGKPVWARNLMKDYSAPAQTWGFSASPLLDGDKLICLVGGDAVVVAFHKDTGKEIWRGPAVKDAGYCPPVIYSVGGKRQLIIWHPSAVNGLDPETGKVFWSVPFAVKASLTVPMPRLDGDRLFLTSFYNGPLMLKLDADGKTPEIVWKGKSNSEQSRLTDGLHSIMPTPIIKDGHIYGVCSYGQLRCLKEDTGERVWETFAATTGKEERWGNAFLVEQDGRFFLFNEQGDLILARLTPKGYDEVSRARLLEPTNTMAGPKGRQVVWVHPAFANRSVYVRNDKEIVCYSLAAE